MIDVRYSSVSLSPTLSRNEKVEQYIRNKTYKPNVLWFWVEGGVIPLRKLAISGSSLRFSQQVVSESMVCES